MITISPFGSKLNTMEFLDFHIASCYEAECALTELVEAWDYGSLYDFEPHDSIRENSMFTGTLNETGWTVYDKIRNGYVVTKEGRILPKKTVSEWLLAFSGPPLVSIRCLEKPQFLDSPFKAWHEPVQSAYNLYMQQKWYLTTTGKIDHGKTIDWYERLTLTSLVDIAPRLQHPTIWSVATDRFMHHVEREESIHKVNDLIRRITHLPDEPYAQWKAAVTMQYMRLAGDE